MFRKSIWSHSAAEGCDQVSLLVFFNVSCQSLLLQRHAKTVESEWSQNGMEFLGRDLRLVGCSCWDDQRALASLEVWVCRCKEENA